MFSKFVILIVTEYVIDFITNLVDQLTHRDVEEDHQR